MSHYLFFIASSLLINTLAFPVINNERKIPTPSKFYLPVPCIVTSGRILVDKNIRPVYEIAERPIDQELLDVSEINPEKSTRNPVLQSDWRIRKTNKNYSLSQYYGGYPAINSANVNVDTPRVYSYITVNNIHNNRPFGQYKWTHGFDSDPTGNNSR